MRWKKACLILLSVALLSATTPLPLGHAVAASTSQGLDDYAAREAQAPELEQFTGGFHGVVITVLVLAVVVWAVWTIWDHEYHEHQPKRDPPPEPRP